MILIVIPAVKEHIPKACTKENREYHIDEKRLEVLQRNFLFVKNFLHQIIAQSKSNNKHQTVVVNPKTSNFKKRFARGPVDFCKVHVCRFNLVKVTKIKGIRNNSLGNWIIAGTTPRMTT